MSKQVLNIKQTTPETFFVQSGTDERVGYTVNTEEGTCECPVNSLRGEYCKHQQTVDEYLMIQEKIPLDDCKIGEPDDFHTNCQFQQLMIDRGFLLYVKNGKHIWKKIVAYEKMDDDKKGEIELNQVDRHSVMHGYCPHFHMFDQKAKVTGNYVVRLTAKNLSKEVSDEILEAVEAVMDKFTNKYIDIAEDFTTSRGQTEADKAVESASL